MHNRVQVSSNERLKMSVLKITNVNKVCLFYRINNSVSYIKPTVHVRTDELLRGGRSSRLHAHIVVQPQQGHRGLLRSTLLLCPKERRPTGTPEGGQRKLLSSRCDLLHLTEKQHRQTRILENTSTNSHHQLSFTLLFIWHFSQRLINLFAQLFIKISNIYLFSRLVYLLHNCGMPFQYLLVNHSLWITSHDSRLSGSVCLSLSPCIYFLGPRSERYTER